MGAPYSAELMNKTSSGFSNEPNPTELVSVVIRVVHYTALTGIGLDVVQKPGSTGASLVGFGLVWETTAA